MMKKRGAAVLLTGAAIAGYSLWVRSREAASIGIIGGADGPTAIFVAGDTVSLWAGAGVVLGAAILFAGAALLRKRK